jgi:hypothetical protein
LKFYLFLFSIPKKKERRIKNNVHDLLLGFSPQWQIDAHFDQSLPHNFVTLLGPKYMLKVKIKYCVETVWVDGMPTPTTAVEHQDLESFLNRVQLPFKISHHTVIFFLTQNSSLQSQIISPNPSPLNLLLFNTQIHCPPDIFKSEVQCKITYASIC